MFLLKENIYCPAMAEGQEEGVGTGRPQKKFDRVGLNVCDEPRNRRNDGVRLGV